MTDQNHLAQRDIMEYESRIRHFDELIERGHQGVADGPGHAQIIGDPARLKQQRDKFSGWIGELRLKPIENWRIDEIEKAGPVGIWDAVGRKLEKLVERIES